MLFIAAASMSQNLVENGGFEELAKKPKNPGEIFLAPPWNSGTMAVPDLYSEDARDDHIKTPINAYGDEKPKDGKNYAGLLMYSYKEKVPRQYLTAELKYPMLAGEYYCVKFHVSFSDLSKYACNNLGCYISKDSVGSESDLILNYQPQIINSTNRIFERQWGWEPICRIYIAEGGEKYITIGNFGSQDETSTTSVKRSREYTQAQFSDGYYYIDDISVTPNATVHNCKCEPGDFAFANLNKEESSFKTDEEDVPKPVFISTTGKVHGKVVEEKPVHKPVVVGFELGKYNLGNKYLQEIDEGIEVLNSNEKIILKLNGHMDESEKVMKDLSKKRIEQVEKYLKSKGVAENRIKTSDLGYQKPIDNTGTRENRSKNMVVEIIFEE